MPEAPPACRESNPGPASRGPETHPNRRRTAALRMQLLWQNRAQLGSTARPWWVKIGAKVLQNFTRIDGPFTAIRLAVPLAPDALARARKSPLRVAA